MEYIIPNISKTSFSSVYQSIRDIHSVLDSDRNVRTSIVNTDNTGGDVTIELDNDFTWNVTGNSYVTALIDADTTYSNIKSNGYTIYYNSDSNNSLNGKTVTLSGGGYLKPY